MESPSEPLVLNSESAKRLAHDAADMIRAGKTESALVLLHSVESFLKKTPASPSRLIDTVHANIGVCYLNSGNPIRAAKYLSKAVALTAGVQQAPALINLSLAHYQLGEIDTAVLEAHKAIRLYESAPRSCHEDRMQAKGLLIIAMCHEAQFHLQKALLSYFRALCFSIERLAPDDEIRCSINEQYEALVRRQGSSGRGKDLDRSAGKIGGSGKARLKAEAKKGKPKNKGETEQIKPKNPVLRMKPRPKLRAPPVSTRPSTHHKHFSTLDSDHTLSSSSSFSHNTLTHGLSAEQGSKGSLYESLEVEERIASIGEKLEGLTVSLRRYGESNREVERKAGEEKEGRKAEDQQKTAKRTLFRVHSLSRVLKTPAKPSRPLPKTDLRYSMYRLS